MQFTCFTLDKFLGHLLFVTAHSYTELKGDRIGASLTRCTVAWIVAANGG